MLKCKYKFMKQPKIKTNSVLKTNDICLLTNKICIGICNKAIMVEEKQIESMKYCKHGTYTNELFNTHGCKTCGSPKLVLCSHESVIGKRRNGKLCNPQQCKYFEAVTDSISTTSDTAVSKLK